VCSRRLPYFIHPYVKMMTDFAGFYLSSWTLALQLRVLQGTSIPSYRPVMQPAGLPHNNAMSCGAKMQHLNCYAITMLLNMGDAPNVKLTINSFPWHDFSGTIPWQLSNSLTFPDFPDKCSPWVMILSLFETSMMRIASGKAYRGGACLRDTHSQASTSLSQNW